MEESLGVNAVGYILPYRVTRAFVKEHGDWIFVYSNDVYNNGAEGMSWPFVGEPNAFMVPTCHKMCKNQRYFHDANFPVFAPFIDRAVAKIPLDGRPIICMPKMGLGCSRMKELAPRLYNYLWDKLKGLEFYAQNVKIKYPTGTIG